MTSGLSLTHRTSEVMSTGHNQIIPLPIKKWASMNRQSQIS